jgi:homoserine kinase
MSQLLVFLQIYCLFFTADIMSKRLRVKAPATVSNLNCGFDILGLAICDPYDIIDLELTDTGVVEIAGIKGCDSLSTDPEQNVAGVTLRAMIRKSGEGIGFRAFIEKGIAPGSGIGSSGASAAAAAYAANVLLGGSFTLAELVSSAMEGERLASGSAHADNVAPALYGGITLIRSYDPLDIIQIRVPPELYCVVIHPGIEIKTSLARQILDRHIPLEIAVRQWGNVGGLIAGLCSNDYDLMSRSLEDHVAEPRRAQLIPGFAEMRKAAMDKGALGAGISGSGPSVFALCRGEERAGAVRESMEACMQSIGVNYRSYLSPVSSTGAAMC